MKIVLTGFMGTGKTSVGKELSRKLGYQFVDTDVLIEGREGKPVALIFKENGEDYFRKTEQAVVKEVSLMNNRICVFHCEIQKVNASTSLRVLSVCSRIVQ